MSLEADQSCWQHWVRWRPAVGWWAEDSIFRRDAVARTESLPGTFASTEDALGAWQRVLLHEAREALSTPLATLPESLYLHPVDVETDEPGIVDTRTASSRGSMTTWPRQPPARASSTSLSEPTTHCPSLAQ